jgi:hypothetical protein
MRRRLHAAVALVVTAGISGLALAGCNGGPSGPPFAFDAQVRSVLSQTPVTSASQCPTPARTEKATQIVNACSRDHKTLYRLAPATATGAQITSFVPSSVGCSVKTRPCPDPSFSPYLVQLVFTDAADSAISNMAYRIYRSYVTSPKTTPATMKYVLLVGGEVENVGSFGDSNPTNMWFTSSSAEQAFLYRLTKCHSPSEQWVAGNVSLHCED